MNIGWIISIYWRIYFYHEKITRSYEYQILENLIEIAIELNKLLLENLLIDVIGIIISISNDFMKKKDGIYASEPTDIILRAVYLCILSNSDNVKNRFIERIKDKYWKKYCEMFPDEKDLLFSRLNDVDPDQLRLNPPHILFEQKVISKLKRENISRFAEKLKQELYK